MTIRYTNSDWAFNSELFAEHLQSMSDDDIAAAAEIMDVSPPAIARWRKGNYTSEYNFPRMSNFINLCNLLDLDPRDYFTL